MSIHKSLLKTWTSKQIQVVLSIDLDSETLSIVGTNNEIETSGSGNTVTIGLPDNVTIAGNLTVNGTTTTVNSTTVSITDQFSKLVTIVQTTT